jgi:hypothetical protein
MGKGISCQVSKQAKHGLLMLGPAGLGSWITSACYNLAWWSGEGRPWEMPTFCEPGFTFAGKAKGNPTSRKLPPPPQLQLAPPHPWPPWMRDVLNRLSRFAETTERGRSPRVVVVAWFAFSQPWYDTTLSRLSTPRGTLQCHHVSMFPLLCVDRGPAP